MEIFFAKFFLTAIFLLAAAIFYYKIFLKRDVAFAIFFYGLLIFAIIFFISFEKIGVGIGLLGILSLIRLRSKIENLFDVGFVFFSITIGLLNAKIDFLSILFSNTILILLLFASATLFFRRELIETEIIFDEIFDDFSDEFLQKKIFEKFKITAEKVEISRIDFLRDSFKLKIFYKK